jgi:acyl-[acyl carrier protein]--UDP-N-acetylglucosamine O-acyltransferase
MITSKLFHLFLRLLRRLKMYFHRPLFRSVGKNFKFDPDGTYSFGTISVGNDVYIGPGACLIASASEIVIGNKVMFGPNVTIVGGVTISDGSDVSCLTSRKSYLKTICRSPSKTMCGSALGRS